MGRGLHVVWSSGAVVNTDPFIVHAVKEGRMFARSVTGGGQRTDSKLIELCASKWLGGHMSIRVKWRTMCYWEQIVHYEQIVRYQSWSSCGQPSCAKFGCSLVAAWLGCGDGHTLGVKLQPIRARGVSFLFNRIKHVGNFGALSFFFFLFHRNNVNFSALQNFWKFNYNRTWGTAIEILHTITRGHVSKSKKTRNGRQLNNFQSPLLIRFS